MVGKRLACATPILANCACKRKFGSHHIGSSFQQLGRQTHRNIRRQNLVVITCTAHDRTRSQTDQDTDCIFNQCNLSAKTRYSRCSYGFLLLRLEQVQFGNITVLEFIGNNLSILFPSFQGISAKSAIHCQDPVVKNNLKLLQPPD